MKQINAPFGEIIELRQILHESGVRLLRVIIRDGGKYFKVELDPGTAYAWGNCMAQWAQDQESQ